MTTARFAPADFNRIATGLRGLCLSFALACTALGSAGVAEAAKHKPTAKKKPVAAHTVTAAPAKRATDRLPATVVLNVDSGEEYLHFNADRLVHPASTAKIMTAYIVFKAISEGRLTRETELAVSSNAASQPRTNFAMRKETSCVKGYQKRKKKRIPVYGTCLGAQTVFKLSVDQALRGLMVHSANDAAYVLAEGLGGNRAGFAKIMNETAQNLGMTDSSFVNPNGWEDARQYTTARDMARLLTAVQRDYPDLYREYFAIPQVTLFNGETEANTNKLLFSANCPGITGGKTGFFKNAGLNLVVMAERNGHRVLVSAYGRPSGAERNAYVCNLINYAFYRIAEDPTAAFDTTRTYPIVSPSLRQAPPLVALPVLQQVSSQQAAARQMPGAR